MTQARPSGEPTRAGASSEPARPRGMRASRADRSSQAVYVISVAAELAGVHPQTLRIYERRGLLDPARTGGGSRLYSEDDIAYLRRIQDLTNAGVNLEGVRRILALVEENATLLEALERTREEARKAIESTHRQYRRDLVPVQRTALPTKWRPNRG
jgi:MerR family transcriptional regulator/heat shock protein HspR